MRRERSRAAMVAALLAALAGAACVERPRFPLYSAVQTTGGFGYYEEQLAEDRFKVGYRAPIEREYDPSRAERRREAERLVALAYDMALMRAAELALARGAESFDLSDRQNNIETDIEDRYGYDPLFAPWPYDRHYHLYAPYPFFPYGPALYRDRYAEIAVDVSFVVDLRRGPARGAFDAAATLERLRAKYPQAVAPAGT